MSATRVSNAYGILDLIQHITKKKTSQPETIKNRRKQKNRIVRMKSTNMELTFSIDFDTLFICPTKSIVPKLLHDVTWRKHVTYV